MRQIATIIACGLALALAVTACAEVTVPPDTFVMGAADFSGPTALTIKAGQAVHFNNPSPSRHILVIGLNAQPIPQTGAPAILNVAAGDTFNSGDNQTITFPMAGTYNITCILHPSMQVTVTVTP